MPSRLSTPHHRLYLAAVIILLVGWVAAAAVFFTATDADADSASVRIIGGQAYAVGSGDTKSDQQVQRFGGVATVRAAAFNDWLGSVWHGQRLAYTLAALATVVAGLTAYIAGLMAE